MSTYSIFSNAYLDPCCFDGNENYYDNGGYFGVNSRVLFKWDVDLGKRFFLPGKENEEDKRKRLEREMNSTNRVYVVPESTLALYGFLLHCISDYSNQYSLKQCPTYKEAYNMVVSELFKVNEEEERPSIQLGFCINYHNKSHLEAELKKCPIAHYAQNLLFYPLVEGGNFLDITANIGCEGTAIRFFHIEYLFGLRFVKEKSFEFSNYKKRSVIAVLEAFHEWAGKKEEVTRKLAGDYMNDKQFYKLFLLWVCEVFNPLHPRSCYQDPPLAERYLLKPKQLEEVEKRGGFLQLPSGLRKEEQKKFSKRPEMPKLQPSPWFSSKAKPASSGTIEEVFSLFLETIIHYRVESSARDLIEREEKMEPNIFRLTKRCKGTRTKKELLILQKLEKGEQLSEEEEEKVKHLGKGRKLNLIEETFLELEEEASKQLLNTVTPSRGFNLPDNMRNAYEDYLPTDEVFRRRLYHKFSISIQPLVVTLKSLALVCKQFYRITRKDSVFGPILFHATLSRDFPGRSGSVFHYCKLAARALMDIGNTTLQHVDRDCCIYSRGTCDPTHWKLNCDPSNSVVRALSAKPVYIQWYKPEVERKIKARRKELMKELGSEEEVEERCREWREYLSGKVEWVGVYWKTFSIPARLKALSELVRQKELLESYRDEAEEAVRKLEKKERNGKITKYEKDVLEVEKENFKVRSELFEECVALHKKVTSYARKVPRPEKTKIFKETKKRRFASLSGSSGSSGSARTARGKRLKSKS